MQLLLVLLSHVEEQNFRTEILAITCNARLIKYMCINNTKRWRKKYLQAHLSQLVLQSQEQVWKRTQWLMLLFYLCVTLMRTWGRQRKGFLEIFPDSILRSVQSADSFAQLGLVMLHHMKYTLHIGMDWVAWARWLDEAQDVKTHCKQGITE